MFKNLRNIFKKLDIVIIIFLLIISFIPEIIFFVKYSEKCNMTYASITIGGKVYKSIPLTGHKGEEEFIVDTSNGINVVVVKDESIAITEADCHDRVCMKPGFINKPGESLVCLPHRVMVEIIGENDDDIILSY